MRQSREQEVHWYLILNQPLFLRQGYVPGRPDMQHIGCMLGSAKS